MTQDNPKAAFVTFYSFKGGVGRSMALINTAGILAGRGFRVLVIDLDLEAPGLSYLRPDAPNATSSSESNVKRQPQSGFVDLLFDAKTRGEEADLFTLSVDELAKRYTQPYPLPDDLRQFPDGSLDIMPAGKFDGQYTQRFDALNFHQLYQDGLGEPLIRAFKKKIAESGHYDYVLVDSRTGFSDEAGICTRDLADYLMILTGLNRQNIEGTSEFLKALRLATDGKKRFQIILSPVPNGEDALLDEREKVARAAFVDAWGTDVELSLQIPYHPQLALTEEPLIFRRRHGYLFDAYRNIERHMLSALGHNSWSILNKIEEALDRKDYTSVLRELRHMVRLDEGKAALSAFALWIGSDKQQTSDDDLAYKAKRTKVPLETMLKDIGGARVIEFVIDNVLLKENRGQIDELLSHLKRLRPDLAGRLFDRLTSNAPDDVDALYDYAIFLFLKGESLHAGELIKQAIAVDKATIEHLILTGQAFQKHLNARAEDFYKWAMDIDPKNPNILVDYGQHLVGIERFAEAEEVLLSSFDYRMQFDEDHETKVHYTLWLLLRMQGRDANRWERCYKYLIQHTFIRFSSNFDRLLQQAETKLSLEELDYAKALAQAFLDENKVADLERYERWRALGPLDPKSLDLSCNPPNRSGTVM